MKGHLTAGLLLLVLAFMATACNVEDIGLSDLDDQTNQEESSIYQQSYVGEDLEENFYDAGYSVTGQNIAKDEWQEHVYETKPGVVYQIEWGASSGSVGLNVYASDDENLVWYEDTSIQHHHWSSIDMSGYPGKKFLIVQVKGVSDAVYYLKIRSAGAFELPEGYYQDLPDDLSADQKELMEVVHKEAFAEIFQKADFPEGSKTIYGDSGNATITVSKNYPRYNYTANFQNYDKNGFTLNGSYSWWIEIDYATVNNPSPKAGFFYQFGGTGGTINVSGGQSLSIPVSFSGLNMENQNNSNYLNNDYLVISYNLQGEEINMATPMIMGVFRKTFKYAFSSLVENFNSLSIDLGGETIWEDGKGGRVVWRIEHDKSSNPVRLKETISFSNYQDNDITLNGSIEFFTYIDNNGIVLPNPNDSNNNSYTGDYAFNDQKITIAGYKDSYANFNVNIFQEGSIWNYSISYSVEGIMHQFPFVRIPVSAGF